MLLYSNFPFIRVLELVSKLFYFFSYQFLPENRAFVEHCIRLRILFSIYNTHRWQWVVGSVYFVYTYLSDSIIINVHFIQHTGWRRTHFFVFVVKLKNVHSEKRWVSSSINIEQWLKRICFFSCFNFAFNFCVSCLWS